MCEKRGWDRHSTKGIFKRLCRTYERCHASLNKHLCREQTPVIWVTHRVTIGSCIFHRDEIAKLKRRQFQILPPQIRLLANLSRQLCFLSRKMIFSMFDTLLFWHEFFR